MTLEEISKQLGKKFGILADSSTHQLKVIAKNLDVAVGDLFLLPSKRGEERIYLFRTTQYANILNRTLEMGDIARNKLIMDDSYFSQDIGEEFLLELNGMVLGYANYGEGGWSFHRPRRLPEHFSEVYRVEPNLAPLVQTLLGSQLGQDGLYVGSLMAGEQALKGVAVYLPPKALSHHIGVFGRTGAGKSNLMMVLIKSVMDYNREQHQESSNQPRASFLAIDPHDEFRNWHMSTGGANGIHGIVLRYHQNELDPLVSPFYYLTLRDTQEPYNRKLRLSRADLTPQDIYSIMEFSEQQVAFAEQQYGKLGEDWITHTFLSNNTANSSNEEGKFLEGTVEAVRRRLGFLRVGQTRLVTSFDSVLKTPYQSDLPDLLCALEQGRVIVVDTTLMNELEQFLFTTVVARTLFALRKALKSATNVEELPEAIRKALGNDEPARQIGQRTLADKLLEKLETLEMPYLTKDGNHLRNLDELPYVNLVIEEAPSILNPARLRFGSVFRDISRQGRKFGIGLTVVSQQVSEIDQGILTQLNTELVMALGNEPERREAIRNASSDLAGFEREMQVMGKGQVLLSTTFKDVPLPVQVPDYDEL